MFMRCRQTLRRRHTGTGYVVRNFEEKEFCVDSNKHRIFLI